MKILSRKNKRGMFFTLLTIAIITLFFSSYWLYTTVNYRTATRARIETMENFLFSVQEDFERETYIVGYRLLLITQDHIALTGDYISNIDHLFAEAFLNGTVFGENHSFLEGVTYSDIINETNEKSSKINVEINLTNPQIEIRQDDPWHLAFSLTSTLKMEDKGDLASWSKPITTVAYIPIEGFEDPFYLVETSGLVPNIINKSNLRPFTDGSDVSNLSKHATNSYYIHTTTSPSFLNRLKGDFSASEQGIESLVNIQELSSQGIPTQSKTCVDYIYFSTDNPSSTTVPGMPSWFRIDYDHKDTYDVGHLI